ncbi:Proton-conducting membrane transporter [Petrocella atlantisensis]|uniref:Proton-conducting membrane transporter n=1 Tax=Petrocella atlantisensis TaxID=2173034 RepID=A0A3P7P2S1_9FIRM|nr:proton-conducting transporter membrane subunit [Petrocella atlantisensis]VDN47800.1 Proton-conducting membrane transporter [Petrocella atlantisensis]
MSLFWLVVLPIITALIGYLSHYKRIYILVGIAQLCTLGVALLTFIQVITSGPITQALGDYQGSIGINLVADPISSFFVVLTCFLFTAMLLFNYHKSYMNRLFLFLFLTLQGLIVAVFLSNDLFDIYTLLEVSTVVVSILIMYKRDSQSIYDGMVYLLTNLVSMAFFLFGLGYIYKIFGTLDLTALKAAIPYVENTDTLILPYAFLITAIGLKSALMPLFSWLPRAHGTPSAPSIVSAVLSGIFVKGGVYLFIRFQDTFKLGLDTSHIFLLIGFATAVIGFIFALSQTDLKLLLAYSTVSQIGLIVFGLSLGSDYSYYGAVYHIMNHAVFKATLFLTAGMIIEKYETRDIRKIKGLFKRMPFVAIIVVIAIMGITGAPLFNGSVSKSLIQKGISYQSYLEYGLLFINLGTIITYIKYATILTGNQQKGHSVRWNQKVALSVLAFACILGGLLGQWFVGILFDLDIDLSFSDLVNKGGVYLISLLIGYIFFKYWYPKIHFFKTMREIELSFNEIIFTIVFFFGSFLSFLLVTY